MAKAVSGGVSLVTDLKNQLEALESIQNSKLVQRKSEEISGVFSTTDVIPVPGSGTGDNPQITEGELLKIIRITPTSALNKIRIMVNVQLELTNTGTVATIALFRNGATDAVQANGKQHTGAISFPLTLYYEEIAGTTSEIEFEVRFGPNANTLTVVDWFLLGAGLVEAREYKP